MVSAIAADLSEVLQSDAATLLSDGWRDFLVDLQERLVRLERSEEDAVVTPPAKRAKSFDPVERLLEEASAIQVASAELAVWVLTYEEGGRERETEVKCAGAFNTKSQALSSAMSVIHRNCSFDWYKDGCEEFEDFRESKDSISDRGKVFFIRASTGDFCQVSIHKLMFNSHLEKVGPYEWIQMEGTDISLDHPLLSNERVARTSSTSHLSDQNQDLYPDCKIDQQAIVNDGGVEAQDTEALHVDQSPGVKARAHNLPDTEALEYPLDNGSQGETGACEEGIPGQSSIGNEVSQEEGTHDEVSERVQEMYQIGEESMDADVTAEELQLQ
eukprot:TRINITY_DN51114_c0_g1_i1.p1 TRINITY_DN51114_c0_g1~~TRINITY_DN51114_c0_g1_i1.p1  ORF type:complete len:339 (-),score=68.97 TRINITY_DN51114_c0_g1_i1:88-1074(-)